LGPSGCGKTTLLRCIVGRLQLNRGEITVLGERPGTRGHQVPGRDVGFMPQETALYKDFSIGEMLHYFGHLHNMDRKDIISREKFLLSFLDLPSSSKKICQLRYRIDVNLYDTKFIYFSSVVVNNVVFPLLVLYFNNHNYYSSMNQLWVLIHYFAKSLNFLFFFCSKFNFNH
jgi:ABC-type ATPase involved in cell division